MGLTASVKEVRAPGYRLSPPGLLLFPDVPEPAGNLCVLSDGPPNAAQRVQRLEIGGRHETNIDGPSNCESGETTSAT